MSRVTNSSLPDFPKVQSSKTLHHAIESSLTKLRSEKQEEQFLDQYIKSLESKLAEAKRLKFADPAVELKKTFANLEKQVKGSFAALNSLQAENRELKSKVEDMRLEGGKCKRIIGSLQKDIKVSTSLARASSICRIREKTNFHDNRMKIDKILSNSASEANLFKDKVSRLSLEMVESKREEIESIRKHTEVMTDLVNRPLTALDLAKVLNHQENHLIAKVKTFKEKIENYCSKCEELKIGIQPVIDSFKHSEYSSFAEGFIKSENQIKDLQVYLLELNAEIDSLSFSNALMTSSLMEKMKDLEKSKKIREEIRKELKNVRENIEKSNMKSMIIKKIMKYVKKTLELTIINYKNQMDAKNFESLDISQAVTLNEKLQILEEIIHKVFLFKAFLAKKHSSFGSIHSIHIKNPGGLRDSLKSLKDMLVESNITQDPHMTDSKLLTPHTFQSNAKRLYDSLISKRIITVHPTSKSLSPIPSSISNKTSK